MRAPPTHPVRRHVLEPGTKDELTHDQLVGSLDASRNLQQAHGIKVTWLAGEAGIQV
jgi:hypothetical protein